MDLHLACTFSFRNARKFGQVLRSAIAKSHRAAVACDQELDLVAAFVPASLRFVTVSVNHAKRLSVGTDTEPQCGKKLASYGSLASYCHVEVENERRQEGNNINREVLRDMLWQCTAESRVPSY